MEDIRSLFSEDMLAEIARSAEGDVTADQVADVLNTVLPTVEEQAQSGEIAQRAAEAQRGNAALSLLPLLLGGNSSGILSSAANSTGVSQGSIGSILKLAAPILLLMLLKNGGSSQQQSSGSLLGSLFGASAQPQQQSAGLLDALLGGPTQSVPQQSGGGLLDALFGGPSQNVQQTQAQPQGTISQADLMNLLSHSNNGQINQADLINLLNASQQPQQAQQSSGSLLGSLFGGPSQPSSSLGGGSMLNTLFNLFGDTGRSTPGDEDDKSGEDKGE